MARNPVGWHPEDIKAALRKNSGLTLSALSSQWGFGRKAVSNTICRADYSSPIERRIADVLGVALHEVWPARWTVSGSSKSRSSGFDPIALPAVRNTQNAKAA